jgi:hypothetical protein
MRKSREEIFIHGSNKLKFEKRWNALAGKAINHEEDKGERGSRKALNWRSLHHRGVFQLRDKQISITQNLIIELQFNPNGIRHDGKLICESSNVDSDSRKTQSKFHR